MRTLFIVALEENGLPIVSAEWDLYDNEYRAREVHRERATFDSRANGIWKIRVNDWDLLERIDQ